MRKLMSKKGFTLVELMIVIVIMGILVAVAVPVYSAVTKNAEKKTCQSNQRIIKENITNYQMTGGPNGAPLDKTDLIAQVGGATKNATFLNMFEGGKLPACPTDEASQYTISITETNGALTYNVACTSSAATEHNPAAAAGA